DLENLLALTPIGLVDKNLSVETTRPQQRRVQHVGPVRRSHDDDPLVGVEPVHFDEQLVEGVFALVVGAHHHTPSTGPSDGVDFVDENDARGFLLGLTKQVTHARRAYAYEHLDKV